MYRETYVKSEMLPVNSDLSKWDSEASDNFCSAVTNNLYFRNFNKNFRLRSPLLKLRKMNLKKETSGSTEHLTMSEDDLKKQYWSLRQKAVEIEKKLNELKLEKYKTKLKKQLPPAPTAVKLAELRDKYYASKVNKDLDTHLKNLLQKIRDYDGTRSPESFTRSDRFALTQLYTSSDKAIFTRRIVAQ